MIELPDRFWSKVEKTETCWLWRASTVQGYGSFGYDRRVWRAHRLSYMALVGPIPEGLELDHLCRNRNCVRPDHLEAVTHRENVQRGELKLVNGGRPVCKKGHAFTEENTYLYTHAGQLRRRCKRCKADQNKEYGRVLRVR